MANNERLLHEVTNLDHNVQLIRVSKHSFTVKYGLHITTELTYAQAAKEYGQCILHSAACCGLLDD